MGHTVTVAKLLVTRVFFLFFLPLLIPTSTLMSSQDMSSLLWVFVFHCAIFHCFTLFSDPYSKYFNIHKTTTRKKKV